MFAIEMSVNIFVLPLLVVLSLAAGLLFRKNKVRSLQRRIVELENEMLISHAEILGLQKSKAENEQNPHSKIPVIPLNSSKDEIAHKSIKKG
jgi:hypothetical protein